MIVYKQTNLLDSGAEALVNTVNLVGVMGKGIALQFREHFDLNYKLYRTACKKNELSIGRMFITRTGRHTGPQYIINFPTKTDWRSSTKLEYIDLGLDDLIDEIRKKNIKSIALPPLGCGNGGLDWSTVKPLIERKLSILHDVLIEVYEPGHHSYARTSLKTEAPALTKSRALILSLAEKYNVLGFDISHLELQKLAYFLQEAGQKDLKLRYEQGTYGPYATNLKHLLAHLEGYYFKGQIRFQDTKPTDTLYLVKDRSEDVAAYLDIELSEDERKRLSTVSKLIEGFESPFGLELLATVHWVRKQSKQPLNIDDIVLAIGKWSLRKRDLMHKNHVSIAVERLAKFGF